LAQQWVQLFLGSAQLLVQLLAAVSGQQQVAYSAVAEAVAAAEEEAEVNLETLMLNLQLKWLRKITL
jgi:hypothetical protein